MNTAVQHASTIPVDFYVCLDRHSIPGALAQSTTSSGHIAYPKNLRYSLFNSDMSQYGYMEIAKIAVNIPILTKKQLLDMQKAVLAKEQELLLQRFHEAQKELNKKREEFKQLERQVESELLQLSAPVAFEEDEHGLETDPEITDEEDMEDLTEKEAEEVLAGVNQVIEEIEADKVAEKQNPPEDGIHF